jgi:hypothetical protein
MSRRGRARVRAAGVMVLDHEGISKAATDRAMYVRLKVAYDDGHRVLARVVVEPVSEAIGRRAGQLIGAAGLTSEQAVDAMVAATAIAQAEQAQAADRVASVLVVTSDVPHLT